MGMRNGFTIDIHRLALLPFSQAWFPDLKSENFVIGRADDHLREAITRRYDDMLRRYPNPALMFGPGA
jgi:hypothetical protein